MEQMPQRKRILLVDDEPINITILRETLEPYERMVALNGKQALKVTRSNNPPDLILLDIMMPGMDGYEVCRQLKADKKTRDIPIIFITAKSQVADETRGFEMGVVDYITKPVSPPVVAARVQTQLALRDAYQKLQAQNQMLIEAEEMRRDLERLSRHDLKGPLSGVLGFTDLLLTDDDLTPAESKKCLESINQSGHQLLDIINLSLNLGKIERGNYPFTPQKIDLLPTLRQIFDESQDIIKFKNIPPVIRIEGQVVTETDRFPIHEEKTLCYSLFSNLIHNALDASPKTRKITIDLSKDEMAMIRIHNFGAVPAKIRDTFFNKYVTANKPNGTGMGTYSAKLMAEIQQGTISMETSNEAGTTISVKLLNVPVVKTEKAKPELSQMPNC